MLHVCNMRLLTTNFQRHIFFSAVLTGCKKKVIKPAGLCSTHFWRVTTQSIPLKIEILKPHIHLLQIIKRSDPNACSFAVVLINQTVSQENEASFVVVLKDQTSVILLFSTVLYWVLFTCVCCIVAVIYQNGTPCWMTILHRHSTATKMAPLVRFYHQ